MKRIALQLLLSVAMIFQGLSAFAAISAHACCCSDGGQVENHCQQDGHGAPCQPNCSHHCIGCTTTAFVAMPAFAAIVPVVTVAVPGARAVAHARYDLPPTRPPIV